MNFVNEEEEDTFNKEDEKANAQVSQDIEYYTLCTYYILYKNVVLVYYFLLTGVHVIYSSL